MSFTFRGKNVSSIAGGSLLINRVERGFLPSLKARLVKVTGKAGAYDFGSDKDVRNFKITATLTANSIADLESKLEDVQAWLDGGDVGELVFDNRLQVSYYAKLEGDTQIQQLGTSAFLTFTLMCPDPTGVGVTNTYNTVAADGTVQVTNAGNEETQPITTITFSRDENAIVLTNGTDSVLLGQPFNAGLSVQPAKDTVLQASVSNPAIMTTAQAVEDGIIYGDFSSNGYSMGQDSNGFGTWDGVHTWRGASKVQSLTTPVSNFQVACDIFFSNIGGDKAALGKIQVYLLDENGAIFGQMAFIDMYGNNDYPAPSARLGNASTGIDMIKYNPSPATYWVYPSSGYMEIARRGREWYCYFGIRNSKGQIYRAVDKRMYVANQYYTPKLAAIQFHVAAFRGSPVYNQMRFGSTRVYKTNYGWGIADTPDANDTPFKKGDTLLVDNEAAAVYLNGKPRADLIDPSSEFFSVPTGSSYIGINPMTNINAVSIDVKNKYK